MTICDYYLGVLGLLLLVLIIIVPYILIIKGVSYLFDRYAKKKYPDLRESERKMKIFDAKYWSIFVTSLILFFFGTLPWLYCIFGVFVS